MNNYERVRSLVVAVNPVAAAGDEGDWRSLWAAVAARLTQLLASNDLAEFDARFGAVADALEICEAPGREAAMPLLFGEFTRRAIAAGFDRTRFVKWFGPKDLLQAAQDRVRGRVLYFDGLKGRGKVLGADGVVYVAVFSMIRGAGYRSLEGGQLVEFTPRFGSFNGVEGFGAYDLAALGETGQDG